jgi:16S rRNA (cytosine1402-N4)-methyltransferase
MEFKHIPVLLTEAIDQLAVTPGTTYVDATAGGGGYTEEILKRGGKVLAIDQDYDAITYLQEKFESNESVKVLQGNFSEIKRLLHEADVEQVDGIVFDLGFSSNQIERSGRGFSFMRDEALDMRMDTKTELTARDIVMQYTEEELTELFTKGEEHNAKKIANAITTNRRNNPIETTFDLVEIIKLIPSSGVIHPATKVFQALRMEVNQEIAHLQKALTDGFEVLSPGGTMAVVSFHSLEDRIIKTYFKKWQVQGLGEMITKKPITATIEETTRNRRARSAKLRSIKKI